MTTEPGASSAKGARNAPADAEPADATPLKRYRAVAAGGSPAVASINAPDILLRLEPGLSVDAKGLKRFGSQTIFLDGVYAGAPFYDNEARQYSLDHHAGCVRPFTLATCEQAAVVLVQGIPLAEGRWTLLVNEPDLDALLAAWVLMNHEELRRDDWHLLKAAMPLLRLEGVLDTHGFGRDLLAALPEEILEVQLGRVEALMKPIRAYREAGSGRPADLVELVLTELEAIDRLLLPPAVVNGLLEVDEVGRVRLRGGRLALLCRSKRGIFEVEEHLRARHGRLLGIVVLEQGDGRFTIRLSDPFLERDLTPLYRALNQRDPNASSGDGVENLWGGSADIGGSPRATGSALSGADVLEEIEGIYGERRRWWRRARDSVRAWQRGLRGGRSS